MIKTKKMPPILQIDGDNRTIDFGFDDTRKKVARQVKLLLGASTASERAEILRVSRLIIKQAIELDRRIRRLINER